MIASVIFIITDGLYFYVEKEKGIQSLNIKEKDKYLF